MEFAGLPVHPLVVHTAAALVLLAGASGWLLAFVPGWRWLTRWLALVTAVAAAAAVYLARESGEALLADRPFLLSPQSEVRQLLLTHQDRAGALMVATACHAGMVVLAFWLLPAPSGLASGRLGHRGSPAVWVRWVVPATLVVLGALAVVWAVLTGHAGARAVWGA